MTAHHIQQTAAVHTVYLSDIIASSRGAVSLPEEVRRRGRRRRADSVATVSNQALCGLLFVIGGPVFRRINN